MLGLLPASRLLFFAFSVEYEHVPPDLNKRRAVLDPCCLDFFDSFEMRVV